MIFFLLFLLSLTVNGILIWYIRKLLEKLWLESEVRTRFITMLGDYGAALKRLYALEELHGEESIKKAIEDTNFVIEACEEYQKILKEGFQEAQGDQEDGEETDQEGGEEDQEGSQAQARSRQEGGEIRLKEGQKVSQDAANYRRVVRDDL